MGRFFVLARAMTPAIVGATSRAAWVLYGGMALFAILTMGGNGVQPADVVAAMRSSVPLRLGVWAAWVAITLPVARASLVVPATYWLRSLPVARAAFWLMHAGILVGCVEVPMIVLCGAGGGLLAGAGAALVPTAAHGLLVAWPMRARELAAGAALVGAIVLGRDDVLAVVALLAAVVGLAAAVARAPELTHVHRRARVFGAAVLALATAHIATLWRRERGVVARGALVAFMGGAAAALGIRNNDVVDEAQAWRVLLAVGGATLPLAAVGVAVAAWRTERRHRWLLDSTGTDGRTRVAATAGVATAWGALLGIVQAALTLALVPHDGAQAAVALVVQAAWGAALAAVVAAAVRRGVRDDRRDSERTFLTVVPFAVAAATGAALAPSTTVLLALLAAFALQAAQATATQVAPELPPAPVEELT